MLILLWSTILFIFLLWCNRSLYKLYAPDVKVFDTATPFRSLFKLLALYFSCAMIVALLIHTQHTIESRYINQMAHDMEKRVAHAEMNAPQGDDSNLAFQPPSQQSFIDIIPAGSVKTKFSNVAGLKEPKEEVQDFISFLKDPDQFKRLGAKVPKGLLFHGPPGVGKTLMARAMAGEADVAFIAVSGSQFDEEFIGVGAARVRKLFKVARKNTPCVVFIDEIDSVAANRNAHHNPAGAQTVNQLLTELDGLDSELNKGLLVIAASNRIEALDPAILRPGRFDRQLELSLPTLSEREEILAVHLENVLFDEGLNLKELAQDSSGLSSADLANWVNEAAIYATKQNKPSVDQNSFHVAIDRIILGTEKSSIRMSEQERTLTAYHEAGHALIGFLLDEHDDVQKVTIAPRGKSLGHTHFIAENEKYSYSRTFYNNKLKSALGGRIAEEIIFGSDQVTSGASSDLKHATNLAYQMVAHMGYSDKIGKVYYSEQHNLIPKELIQSEVSGLIEKNYSETKELMEANIDKLHKLAKALLDNETIEKDELIQILG